MSPGQPPGRVGSTGRSPVTAAQHHVFPDGPGVTVIYRKPCATEKSELFGAAPHGVEAAHVVKALCRALGVGPGAIEVEADPDARHLRDHEARCYILDAAGARVAHVTGLSFAWIRVEAARLNRQGWRAPSLAAVVGPSGPPDPTRPGPTTTAQGNRVAA